MQSIFQGSGAWDRFNWGSHRQHRCTVYTAGSRSSVLVAKYGIRSDVYHFRHLGAHPTGNTWAPSATDNQRSGAMVPNPDARGKGEIQGTEKGRTSATERDEIGGIDRRKWRRRTWRIIINKFCRVVLFDKCANYQINQLSWIFELDMSIS